MKRQKKTFLRAKRIFSSEIKKQIVKDIESGKCSVSEASLEIAVSQQAIYNWIYRYSVHLKKGRTLIVENKSESYKSGELEKKLLELEAALGRKQMEIDLLNKVIDQANEFYKTDLKKNSSKKHSNGSGSTKESSTGTK